MGTGLFLKCLVGTQEPQERSVRCSLRFLVSLRYSIRAMTVKTSEADAVPLRSSPPLLPLRLLRGQARVHSDDPTATSWPAHPQPPGLQTGVRDGMLRPSPSPGSVLWGNRSLQSIFSH